MSEKNAYTGSDRKMLPFSFIWLLAGLFVMYKIGIHEIMLSLGLEISLSDEEEKPGPVLMGFTMFIVLLLWPLIWIDYLQSKE
ncbi:MAG: hypothetical protein LWY06_08790 [Firmicutes bacterium]|nr:hypothetical protein [Bacillota bacterium]